MLPCQVTCMGPMQNCFRFQRSCRGSLPMYVWLGNRGDDAAVLSDVCAVSRGCWNLQQTSWIQWQGMQGEGRHRQLARDHATFFSPSHLFILSFFLCVCVCLCVHMSVHVLKSDEGRKASSSGTHFIINCIYLLQFMRYHCCSLQNVFYCQLQDN